jgi:hypothetical protein
MKKKKAAKDNKSNDKIARKNIKLVIIDELTQIISKLGKGSKKIDKTIQRAAEKLAKEIKVENTPAAVSQDLNTDVTVPQVVETPKKAAVRIVGEKTAKPRKRASPAVKPEIKK